MEGILRNANYRSKYLLYAEKMSVYSAKFKCGAGADEAMPTLLSDLLPIGEGANQVSVISQHSFA